MDDLLDDDKKSAGRMVSIETASLDVYAKYVLRSICQQVRLSALAGSVCSAMGLALSSLWDGWPVQLLGGAGC